LFAEKHGVYSVVIGTGIGLGMHLIIRLIDFVFIDGFKFRLNFWHPEIWKVLRLSLPKMASLFTLQLTLLVYNVVGVGLVDGSISAFNYARNVQGFAVSMFGVALATAVFPFLVDLKASGDMQKVRLKIEDSILRILIFTLPASVGLFLLSKDTVNTLFNRGAFDENDLYMTMVVLGVFAVSISFESLNHLLIRIYNAFENTILPLLAGILFIGVNVGLVFGFAEEYGVVVFGLAYGLGFVVQVLVLFLLLRKYVKLEWGRVFKDVGRMLVAVFLMGVVVRYGRDLFGGEFLSLIEYVGLIGLGGMVYMIGIWFLGVFRYTGFEHHIKKIIGNG
jgi:putative peptidoglycan lipid II flippase